MASKRLEIVKTHLAGTFPRQDTLDEYRRRGQEINHGILERAFKSPYFDFAAKIIATISDNPIYHHGLYVEGSRASLRESIIQRIFPVFKASGLTPEVDKENPFVKLLLCVLCTSYDLSLGVRMVVHFGLYTDSITNLGTAKHDRYIERALRLQDYGCFCMTEIGHGSDVSSVETIAEYRHATREFIINSPTPSAAKFWVGALGKTANMAVVFAQLIMDGTRMGVHVFLVQIRDYETHQPMEGVIIGDCGAKEGNHGIDNGWALFKNFKVPYDALLDRLGQISEQGKYKSPIKSKEKRFGLMLVGLSGGRVSCIGAAEGYMRNAVTTAIRYAATRKQFGKPEKLILDYELHRYRLMPVLAKTFAVRVAFQSMIQMFLETQPKIRENPACAEGEEFHAILSSMKAIGSSYAFEGINECRQACGGHGYSAYNGFKRWMTDSDVHHTWEGDNSVLIQQASKFLTKAFKKSMGGQRVPGTCGFLNKLQGKFVFTSADDLNNMMDLMEHRLIGAFNRSIEHIQVMSAQTESMNDAWEKSQYHFMLNLAKYFGEFFICNKWLQLANTVETQNKPTGDMLKKICLLYILHLFEKDTQSIFAHVSSGEIRKIQEHVRALCHEVAEASIKIIDAIALPDQFLGSEIGRSDGENFNKYFELIEQAPNCYDPPEWIDLLKKIRTSF